MTLSSSADNRPALVVICGPTAAGKTALALDLAEALGGEIISADSRQVYRLMNIGTAKPGAAEQQRVRHHLVDVAWPDEEFHAARFACLAEQAVHAICRQDKKPFLVGGTGLYIRALTEGLLQGPGANPELRRELHARAEQEGRCALHAELAGVDPETAARLHPNDMVRIVRALEVHRHSGRSLAMLQDEHAFGSQPYRVLKFGLDLEREELYRRIDRRAEVMLEEGLLEEAQSLLQAGYDPALKSLQTIGYRQAFAVLHGEMNRNDALEDLKRMTRRYAKQQLTWFRKDKSIIWLESCVDFATIRRLIVEFHGI